MEQIQSLKNVCYLGPRSELFTEDSEFGECLLFWTAPEADPEARLRRESGDSLRTQNIINQQDG